MAKSQFTWDNKKNDANLKKHCLSSEMAQAALIDLSRVIAWDSTHSETEKLFYRFGKIQGGV